MLNFKVSFKDLNLLVASLILPSILLPVRYSSLILIILSLVSIYNMTKKSQNINFKLLVPFLLYFTSILFSFFIDVSYGIFEGEFILRNISFLIVPFYIFSSNFSRINILSILKGSSIFITFVGIIFLIIWIFGYFNNKNQIEYQKDNWFKNELLIEKNYIHKDSILNIEIPILSKKPSLRKVFMLKGIEDNALISRELVLKVTNTNEDVWILIRNVNYGNCKVWFNATRGSIGNIEGDGKVHLEKLSNGFCKLILANNIDIKSIREWFYISFVSNNGSYTWNNNYSKNVKIQLKQPRIYLSANKSLLNTKSIFKYKLTHFNYLKSYAHSTYFGLVFAFAFIVLIFNPYSNKYINFILLFLNAFFLFSLASKAIILSLLILLPIYSLFNSFNYKYLVPTFFICTFLFFNGHVKERFIDMTKTLIYKNENKKMNDLKKLSTNNRVVIYKNYLDLIKRNYLKGYGYINGVNTVSIKYRYNYNAHNQYLQSLFHSGVFGLLSLILFILYPYKFKRQKKNYGLEFLVILVLFNFLFESFLYRQWGLIFVGFSYAIYIQFLNKCK